MSKVILWLALVSLTGSPLAAFLILLGLGLLLDRFTFRMLPDPVQGWARWRRVRTLEAQLAHNPHDRRARLELAELLVQQRRTKRAAEMIRKNLEAGDRDPNTLLIAGRAFAGAKEFEEAERCFTSVIAEDENFRMGEAELELGRLYLARGESHRAVPCFERAAKSRPSSTETKYLLALSLELTDDTERAREVRRRAWSDYVAMPGFQRRRERPWAWRIEPWRPAVYALAFAATIFVLGQLIGPARQRPATQVESMQR